MQLHSKQQHSSLQPHMQMLHNLQLHKQMLRNLQQHSNQRHSMQLHSKPLQWCLRRCLLRQQVLNTQQ